MIYLNLPLEIWKYILLFLIIIILPIIFYIFRSDAMHPYLRMISLWLAVLLELNFINMYYTLKNYLDYSKVVGEKGPKGDTGPRGYRGKSFVCNQCGDAGKDLKEVYATNINDNNVKVNHPKLKSGKCVFPFVHDNEFQYKCSVEKREENEMNDADTYGWCATSLKDDLTYKTFGYCKNSDLEKERILRNKSRQSRQKKYFETNYGLIDLDVVSGPRSNVKCPKGYKRINQDLNSLADGNYIYFCKKIALGESGITDIKVIKDNESCPENYRKIPKNLNEYAGGKELYVCLKKEDKNFIKDVKVVKNKECKENYDKINVNLNEDAGGDELYLCLNKNAPASAIIDTAFIWGDDNNLYFFKDDDFWKYDDKKDTIESGFPKKISSFWGKLPSNLDAVFTYPYDNNTYFFKGSRYYMYDKKKLKIASGYPKSIKMNWKGVPDNLDAIYIDNRTKTTFFIKGKYYYKYNDKNKRVEAGFPKILNRKWKDAPTNISAMFYYPYKESVFIIQYDKAFKYNLSKEMTSDSPKKMVEQFAGLV